MKLLFSILSLFLSMNTFSNTFFSLKNYAYDKNNQSILYHEGKGSFLLKSFDEVTGKERFRLRHFDKITTYKICQRNNFIITGSKDEKVRIFSSVNGSLLKVLPQKGEVVSVDCSDDGRFFLTASKRDTSVKVWGSSDFKLRHTLDTGYSEGGPGFTYASFSKNTTDLIVSVGYVDVYLDSDGPYRGAYYTWNLENGQKYVYPSSHINQGYVAGNIFFQYNNLDEVFVYDLKTKKLFDKNAEAGTLIHIFSDGKRYLKSHKSGTILKLVDAKTGEILQSFESTNKYRNFSVFPKENKMIWGDFYGKYVLDLNSLSIVKELTKFRTSVKYHVIDDNRLIQTTENVDLMLLDIQNDSKIAQFHSRSPISKIAIFPNEKQALIRVSDVDQTKCEYRVFDTADGSILNSNKVYSTICNINSDRFNLQLTPDGKNFFYGNSKYNSDSLDHVNTIEKRTSIYRGEHKLTFSKNGERFISLEDAKVLTTKRLSWDGIFRKKDGTRITRLSNALYYNNARNLIVQSFVDNIFHIYKNDNLKKPIKTFRLPWHHTLVKINPTARLIYDECNIFDFKGNEINHKIPCKSFYIKSVVFSKDGKKLFLLGAERFNQSKKSFIKTYTVKRWKEIAHVDVKIKQSELNNLWISNDGALAYVSAYERGRIEVLDLKKSSWLRNLSHMGIIEQLKMIGSERVIIKSRDDNVTIWNPWSGEKVWSLRD